MPSGRVARLSGVTIRLDQFMKLQGLADSGGQAKMFIQSGLVMVDGVIETRRGRKLREGDVVAMAESPQETHTVPPLASDED